MGHVNKYNKKANDKKRTRREENVFIRSYSVRCPRERLKASTELS